MQSMVHRIMDAIKIEDMQFKLCDSKKIGYPNTVRLYRNTANTEAGRISKGKGDERLQFINGMQARMSKRRLWAYLSQNRRRPGATRHGQTMPGRQSCQLPLARRSRQPIPVYGIIAASWHSNENNPCSMNNIEELPPFPEGWYYVTSRNALQKENLIRKTWMGEEIVAWCDAEGRICVAEAVCPHMGSDLGPEAGGRVRDGCLVCPFHGFTFNTGGRCVAAPFDPPPGSARLKVYETREMLGLVFAWWGSEGRAPQWRLPEDPPAGPEWCEPGFHTFRFPGHPQETTENSVDLAHLRYTHGYDNVYPVGEVKVDGACLQTSFDFRRTRKIAGIFDTMYDVSAVAHIYGLGYSYVEVHEKSIDLRSRLWVLATPVDGTLIDLTLVSQAHEMLNPKRPVAGLRFIPVKLRHRLMNRILLISQKLDVQQDVTIWGRKRYRPRPRLNLTDGEIPTYRRYCKQFYPELYPEASLDRMQISSAGG